jgi:hypothetical protein
MNEITIDQGIGFITGNWFWMLPALLSIAFIAGGVVHFIGGLCYSYVFRKEPEEEYLDRMIPVLVKIGICEEKYISKQQSGRFEEVVFCMVIVYPAIVWFLSFLIHILPMWALYALISTWGFMFAMRMGVDATKKAKEVMKALNIHKEDKSAHKG